MAAQISEQFDDLDDTVKETVLIRLADELEHHLDGGLLYRESEVMLEQARKRRSYTLLLAEQLQLPQLSAEFETVFAEHDIPHVPLVLRGDPATPRKMLPRSISKIS